MSEQPATPDAAGAAADPVTQSWAATDPAAPAGEPPSPAPPPPAEAFDGGAATMVADRPEIPVGAAFVGGLALALILKRLAR